MEKDTRNVKKDDNKKECESLNKFKNGDANKTVNKQRSTHNTLYIYIYNILAILAILFGVDNFK